MNIKKLISTSILPATFAFLQALEENNNRPWFNAHKDEYLAAQANVHAFVDGLIYHMNQHDRLDNTSGKGSVYRIYSDVRFHKERPPYDPRFAFGLSRSTKFRRGGYYMHIKPGNTYLECGFFGPNKEDLLRIRQDIAANLDEWRALLADPGILADYGTMRGEKVLTAPRGFDKEEPGIDLIRHKRFTFRRDFEDHEVLSPGFMEEADRIFQSIRPFFDYMSDVLTTNANGESIL